MGELRQGQMVPEVDSVVFGDVVEQQVFVFISLSASESFEKSKYLTLKFEFSPKIVIDTKLLRVQCLRACPPSIP